MGNISHRFSSTTRATLNICCPYSSSHELDAALDATVLQNDVDAAVGNDNLAFVFQQQLMTANAPPLDLLIRTSGETRLSDFLLWQVGGRRCGGLLCHM